MIEEGISDAEIAARLTNEHYEVEIEAKIADREYEMRYGRDDDDDRMTTAQREFHDRLSLGRNEAGEWLGFM